MKTDQVVNNGHCSPISRWVGGKRWLTKQIEDFLPPDFKQYHEPFVGSGSIYFYLRSKNLLNNSHSIFLSDLNIRLINCFRQLRNNNSEVIEYLNSYENTDSLYYTLRSRKSKNKTEDAAIFLFLNRTSFNGVYRVNLNGEYNVPFGYRSLRKLFDLDLISQSPKLLKGVKLSVNDFESTLDRVKKGDLVFLDPPYTVAHNVNGFLRYNENIFSWGDQIRLKQYIDNINKKKAFFIMTNANHKSVIELFGKTGEMTILERQSTVGGKDSKRGLVSELIITNR